MKQETSDLRQSIQRVIVEKIPSGAIFDAHAIIDYLLQNDTNVYIRFYTLYANADISSFHGIVSQQIDSLCDLQLIEEIPMGDTYQQSWSKTIHCTYRLCKCWRKK